MNFTHTFIERPILAVVVSMFIVLIGLGALIALPVAQYPDIVPPTIQVTTIYPGASADILAKTVATPLEQEINGVENMLYMTSQSTGDGKLTLTVTFRIGTDLNIAQVLTQNRVTTALPRLPDDVQREGVTVQKSTPNILLIIHLTSPKGTRDQGYLSNYATLHIRDVLARLPGMGDVEVASPHDYAMRIWIDPDKAAADNLTGDEIVAALRAQNVQVSAGVLNQPPTTGAFQMNIQTLGRLTRRVRPHHHQERRSRPYHAGERYRPGGGRCRGLRNGRLSRYEPRRGRFRLRPAWGELARCRA
jgi:HAE1 family hydrophobic/amphiphilic exporter-1